MKRDLEFRKNISINSPEKKKCQKEKKWENLKGGGVELESLRYDPHDQNSSVEV